VHILTPCYFKIRSFRNIVLSTPGFHKCSRIFKFYIKIVYAFLVSLMRASCVDELILRYLLTERHFLIFEPYCLQRTKFVTESNIDKAATVV
jgi:hypothetical protein